MEALSFPVMCMCGGGGVFSPFVFLSLSYFRLVCYLKFHVPYVHTWLSTRWKTLGKAAKQSSTDCPGSRNTFWNPNNSFSGPPLTWWGHSFDVHLHALPQKLPYCTKPEDIAFKVSKHRPGRAREKPALSMSLGVHVRFRLLLYLQAYCGAVIHREGNMPQCRGHN